MDTISQELKKSGIEIVRPLDTLFVNGIAKYVSELLSNSLPGLRLNYDMLFMEISRLPMYLAKMPPEMADACYFYKDSSIYFRDTLSEEKIKKAAVHECIHHIQQVKNKNGLLIRLGLCNFTEFRAYGTALNEGAVQYISALLTKERHDTVKYYDITLPTDSPSYYPLLCNLVKQLGYITGFETLYDSTIFSTDIFFKKLIEVCGQKASYHIQQNLDKLLHYEDEISLKNAKLQTTDCTPAKVQKISDNIANLKKKIRDTFIETQNCIIYSFFDNYYDKLSTTTQIESYRKYLYSFKNLIGTTENYHSYNDYYIQQMAKLDNKYEAIVNNVALVEIKPSKLSYILKALKNFFGISKETEDVYNR